VPTPPERRLVGHSLEPEATAERGSVLQIRAECRFVVPPVEFLEEKEFFSNRSSIAKVSIITTVNVIAIIRVPVPIMPVFKCTT